MGRSAPHSPALKLYLALNAAALLGAAALMALLARSGGYSAPRLALVAVAVLLGLAAAALAMLLHRRASIENRLILPFVHPGSRLRIILAASFVAFWCLVWFPPQYTGDAYYYFIGIYPLFLCGLLLTGSALLWLSAAGASSTPSWIAYFRQQRTALVVALMALAALALLVLLAAQFRILQGFEPYWYGAGVPLLASQVLIASCLAVLVLRFETWSGHSPLAADTILFVLIGSSPLHCGLGTPFLPATGSRPPDPPILSSTHFPTRPHTTWQANSPSSARVFSTACPSTVPCT